MRLVPQRVAMGRIHSIEVVEMIRVVALSTAYILALSTFLLAYSLMPMPS